VNEAMTEQVPLAGRVQGKVALVTGGASGIGQATALLLAAEGALVAVADLNADGAAATTRAIDEAGGRATVYRFDAAEELGWQTALERLTGEFGRLDIAVNAAGIAFGRPLADMTLAEWRRVPSINLDSVFLGTQAAIRAMRATARGSVINVSSVAGIKAQPGAAAYCASKAAVCMVTRVAALECAQAGLQVRVAGRRGDADLATIADVAQPGETARQRRGRLPSPGPGRSAQALCHRRRSGSAHPLPGFRRIGLCHWGRVGH